MPPSTMASSTESTDTMALPVKIWCSTDPPPSPSRSRLRRWVAAGTADGGIWPPAVSRRTSEATASGLVPPGTGASAGSAVSWWPGACGSGVVFSDMGFSFVAGRLRERRRRRAAGGVGGGAGFGFGGRDAGHHQAQHVAGGGGGHDADQLAAVEHGDPVRQLHDLVEFGGDDHDRSAVIAFGDDALVHELDRADVQAAGGLGGDEEPQRAGEFAGQHHLLLVAAREGADGGGDRGGADVEFLDFLGRVL